MAMLARVFDGVIEKIGQCLLNAIGINLRLARTIEMRSDSNLLFFGHQSIDLQHILQQL